MDDGGSGKREKVGYVGSGAAALQGAAVPERLDGDAPVPVAFDEQLVGAGIGERIAGFGIRQELYTRS